MIIKNTFKIMWRNFGTIIKSCLYKLLVFCLVLLAGYGVLYPVIDQFMQEGFFDECYKLFHEGVFAFNFDAIVTNFNAVCDSFSNIMQTHISFTWNFIGVLILLFIVLPILLGLSKVAEYGVLYNRLTSNSKFDLTTCYFENLKKGLGYRCFRLIFTIPIAIISIALCYLIPKLFVGTTGAIISLCLIVVCVLFLCSLFMTLFLIYEPNLLIKDCTPWQSLKQSVQSVKKYGFAKVFFNIFAFSFIVVIFNTFCAAFTYGLTLIITVPITIQLSNVLRMVLSFDCLGMDYYIDDKNICVTKKYKEKENIENMINVI